jgi:putative DNA primase/helicase
VWEILSAIIRPYVSWGKTSWFYSTVGNNGKGTLCALARNLLGDGAHTSIPLSDFGKDFALEPLLNANAVIVDENDVGLFIDKAANLKAIVTNDVIQINRKYLSSFAFQFYGHMIQCLNELPRMKDRSESNYRRQLFVPFEKSFTGRERKYIKNDYLQRSDVLEYVLWRVLHMTHYELSTPPATDVILDEYREYNDPVRAFWSEFRDQFCWDLLPFTFLYDLYRAWYSRVSTGTPLQVSQFVTSLYGLLDRDPMWHCKDRKAKLRPAQKMNFPEPLIAEYDLKQWMRAGSKPGDPTACRPDLKPNYRGVLRRQSAIAALTPASEIDVEEKAS